MRPTTRARRGAAGRRASGESSGLCEQLDEHDRGHHGIARKVPLKIPVLRTGETAAARQPARDDLHNLLDEPHRRAVRQKIQRGFA
jgi:hypothetical protein